MRNVLLLIFCSLLFSQCTITKRIHKPGWHIDSKKGWSAESSDNEKVVSFYEKKPETVEAEKEHIDQNLENKTVEQFDTHGPQNIVRDEALESQGNNEQNQVKLEKEKNSKTLIVEPKALPDEPVDQEEKDEKKREFPFWLFILIVISILLIGSIFLGLIWMYAFTSLIYGAFFGSLFLEILAGIIVSIPILGIYYGFFYLIFYLFYGKDPYYSSKKEFNRAYWKISSLFIGILAGLILVFVFVILANIL
jgi:hypothetical protein